MPVAVMGPGRRTLALRLCGECSAASAWYGTGVVSTGGGDLRLDIEIAPGYTAQTAR